MRVHLYFLLFLLFILSCCGSDEGGPSEEIIYINKSQTKANLDLLLKNISHFQVKVLFEAGADPYVGSDQTQKPYWNLLEDNIKALFHASNNTINLTIPKSLSQMSSIGVKAKSSWSAGELVALANENGHQESSGVNGYATVLFLNGHYRHPNNQIERSVIAVSITGTTIIAVFKDVIRGMGLTPDDRISVFVEQSTLIHEFGHAFGLVNNGVPLTSEHHDHENGAHCTNTNCVLYWQNEGSKDLIKFAKKLMTSGSNIMFGKECLDDIAAYPLADPAP